MREKKIKQFQGCWVPRKLTAGKPPPWAQGSAGHGGGQMEGTSARRKGHPGRGGTSGRSAGTKKKGCSKQREKFVQAWLGTGFLFQIPRIGASSVTRSGSKLGDGGEARERDSRARLEGS